MGELQEYKVIVFCGNYITPHGLCHFCFVFSLLSGSREIDFFGGKDLRLNLAIHNRRY